jgi:hypothetical protein
MDNQTNLLLVIVALILVFCMSRENFTQDSRVVPPCPAGTERGKNGLDCKSMGDLYGL